MDKIYMKETIRLHGVIILIMSDRRTKFNSNFWANIQLELGSRLDLSTTFHS